MFPDLLKKSQEPSIRINSRFHLFVYAITLTSQLLLGSLKKLLTPGPSPESRGE
jgi:hypothetical protein